MIRQVKYSLPEKELVTLGKGWVFHSLWKLGEKMVNNGKDVIWDLIEYLGGNDSAKCDILNSIIDWLDPEIIEKFSEDFKRHHKIMGYNDYELCLDCQETYDSNNRHYCDNEDTLPPAGVNKFFSSLVPEC